MRAEHQRNETSERTEASLALAPARFDRTIVIDAPACARTRRDRRPRDDVVGAILDPVSHGIYVLPKYVPSSTLKDPTWQNTHVISGDVEAAVRELKAKPGGFEHLFAWFDGGDVTFPSSDPNFKVRLAEPDYRYMRDVVEGIGVLVIGRRLFDQTDGWGGRHPFDKSIVVVTHSVPEQWVAAHPDAPFTFVTDGLPSAIERAQAIAGDRNVVVTPGKLASQCLELGLLDEISIDLAPVLLGSGVRLFDELRAAPILLDGPDLLVEGSRVTHLRYQVRRP